MASSPALTGEVHFAPWLMTLCQTADMWYLGGGGVFAFCLSCCCYSCYLMCLVFSVGCGTRFLSFSWKKTVPTAHVEKELFFSFLFFFLSLYFFLSFFFLFFSSFLFSSCLSFSFFLSLLPSCLSFFPFFFLLTRELEKLMIKKIVSEYCHYLGLPCNFASILSPNKDILKAHSTRKVQMRPQTSHT